MTAKWTFCRPSGWSDVRKRAQSHPVATGFNRLRLLVHEFEPLLEHFHGSPPATTNSAVNFLAAV
jgi:hypothetical protein